MGKLIHNTRRCISALIILLGIASICHGELAAQPAAPFTLSDLDGQKHTLADKKTPALVLFFFEPGSRLCMARMQTLDMLTRQYGPEKISVWSITRSARSAVMPSLVKTYPHIPILIDTGMVSEKYHARSILPTTCIIGPDGTVQESIQGGGMMADVRLTRAVARMMQNCTQQKSADKTTGRASIADAPAGRKQIDATSATNRVLEKKPGADKREKKSARSTQAALPGQKTEHSKPDGPSREFRNQQTDLAQEPTAEDMAAVERSRAYKQHQEWGEDHSKAGQDTEKRHIETRL